DECRLPAVSSRQRRKSRTEFIIPSQHLIAVDHLDPVRKPCRAHLVERRNSTARGGSSMTVGTVLVTGATGDTGGATVEQLLARGRRGRALAHRKGARSERLQELGAEVVFGDFLDLD